MQRWGMIVALSRFGKFSNLHLMQSLTTERPEVRTFTFFGSQYRSPYISFVPVEAIEQRPHRQRLRAASADQRRPRASCSTPTTARSTFPFVDVANVYTSWYSTVLPAAARGDDLDSDRPVADRSQQRRRPGGGG